MPVSPIRLSAAGLLLALGVAACGASGATTGPAGATASPAAVSTSPVAAASLDATVPTAGGKVSANTASAGEITAALTAAGVPNADRWTREIQEYRPYPADDPALQRLQDNLAKYNPDPATLAGILSVLQP